MSFALGGAGSEFFAQEEGGNDAFAPDAPEIVASERIGDLFGDDSAESVIQIVVSGPDVVSLDGLTVVTGVSETLRSGPLGSRLVDRADRPAIVSYLTPLFQAGIEPTTDAALDGAYVEALGQLPPEQAGFVAGLFPEGTEPALAESDLGLMVVFVRGVSDTDQLDEFVDLQDQAAMELEELTLPAGYSADPFSFELVFATGDEFQQEVGRLFLAALFIILTILALVFVIYPRDGRLIAYGGFAALGISTALLVLEVVPPFVPLAVFAIVFLTWALTSSGMRRTTADTLVTILVIILAINWVAGAWGILYNEPNPMTQIIPILLIGLGVDYSIHLTTRYRDEVSSGVSVPNAIGIAIRTVGVALVLATVTTAVGFLTNLTSEIRALQQFGVLSAVGIVASFVLMLTLAPAIRVLLDRRGEAIGTLEPDQLRGGTSRALPRVIGRTAGLATRAPAATLIVALLLGALGAYGVTRLETKFSFIDFVPTTSPIRDTFATILDRFGGGLGESAQVLIEGDISDGEAWNGMAASLDNLRDTPNVLQFGPVPQAESPVSLAAQLTDAESELFDPDVAAVAAAVGLGPDLAVLPDADMAPLYDALFESAPDRAARVLVPGYQAALFDIATNAGEAGAADLRLDLIDDFAPVDGLEGVEATPTSSEIINEVIVTTLRDGQLSSLFITLGAALLLLVINFLVEARRPLLGVITTLPVIMVVIWSFAIMAALGIAFGPVTATISALAIGIGIPYMIHITHRYGEERAHRDAEAAIEETLTHTGGALAGSALTTMAGFGILMTSTTIPFQQFGFVTAYTIGLAMAAAILVQPSMLVLWDRWHTKRGQAAIDSEALTEALHG